jgi:hypothetical protein
MKQTTFALRLAAALWCSLALGGAATAATSFSNSLTGFTGNSTQPATQAAVAAAGFNFFTTQGATEDPPGEFFDPTIEFDSAGAHFGNFSEGDGGRNYIRTNDTDYANVRFVAEATIVAPSLDSQAFYFGLGSGNAASFRTPDWTTAASSVMHWGEVDITDPTLTTLKNRNTFGEFADTPAPTLQPGTHRLRLSYDWFRKTAEFSIDTNYTTGPFIADVTAAPVDVRDAYGASGWPAEPARIFFGGDDAVVFKDFQVTVSSPTLVLGDLDMSGTITPADWAILRMNQRVNFSGKTHEQAYFMGDLTADLANNHADFALFKSIYDAANGSGAFVAMLAGVPEPSTFALVSFFGAVMLSGIRRGRTIGRAAILNR